MKVFWYIILLVLDVLIYWTEAKTWRELRDESNRALGIKKKEAFDLLIMRRIL